MSVQKIEELCRVFSLPVSTYMLASKQDEIVSKINEVIAMVNEPKKESRDAATQKFDECIEKIVNLFTVSQAMAKNEFSVANENTKLREAIEEAVGIMDEGTAKQILLNAIQKGGEQ